MTSDHDPSNLLACPRDRSALAPAGENRLRCVLGHEYPIVDGVPVLLVDGVTPTLDVATASLRRAHGLPQGDARAPELHLESLGISDAERDAIVRLWRTGATAIDPVVQYLVAATCGTAYTDARGKLKEYPIPDIPLPAACGSVLVDVGCNWGRWSVAAARKGYRVIGIDPQLGAVVAARRVSAQLGLDIAYVCADVRSLPVRMHGADTVFSYSVLQHFSRPDCVAALEQIGRSLKPGGLALIQMANAHGMRSLYQRLRRGLRPGRGFEVRYYRPAELRSLFEGTIGVTSLSVDCFFGLGLQMTDLHLLDIRGRLATRISAQLQHASRFAPPLTLFADSLYVHAIRS